MNKVYIKEVIVVEGHHDRQKIKSCVDAEVIISHGTHFSSAFLDLCDALNKKCGIIVFTDPDGPGEMIRRKISERVGSCKHASLHVSQTKTKDKVGIEHASCDMIIDALERVASFDVNKVTLSFDAFNALGLAGQRSSQTLRDKLSYVYSIPRMNAKRCFKVLNMMGLTYNDIKEVLEGGEDFGKYR